MTVAGQPGQNSRDKTAVREKSGQVNLHRLALDVILDENTKCKGKDNTQPDDHTFSSVTVKSGNFVKELYFVTEKILFSKIHLKKLIYCDNETFHEMFFLFQIYFINMLVDDSLILPRHLSLCEIYLWDKLLWVLLLWDILL